SYDDDALVLEILRRGQRRPTRLNREAQISNLGPAVGRPIEATGNSAPCSRARRISHAHWHQLAAKGDSNDSIGIVADGCDYSGDLGAVAVHVGGIVIVVVKVPPWNQL